MPPFFCRTHTPEFPDILAQLNCSLILSTYQANKVILLSPQTDGLIQLPRAFNKPMGMAVDGHRLAVATQQEVIVLANAPALAAAYPKQPNIYDSLFVPQATYYSGELDIHDLGFRSASLPLHGLEVQTLHKLVSYKVRLVLLNNFSQGQRPGNEEMSPQGVALGFINAAPSGLSYL